MNAEKKQSTTINIDISHLQSTEDNRKWVFIDLDEYETQIRCKVRQEEFQKRLDEKRVARKQAKAERERLYYELFPRFCGIFMTAMAVFSLITSSIAGTLTLLMAGSLLLVLPSWKNNK